MTERAEWPSASTRPSQPAVGPHSPWPRRQELASQPAPDPAPPVEDPREAAARCHQRAGDLLKKSQRDRATFGDTGRSFQADQALFTEVAALNLHALVALHLDR